MAHIVCATQSLSGLLYSSSELLRRLQAAGHRVTYLTKPGGKAVVQAQDLHYQALPGAKRVPPRDEASTGLSLWRGVRTIKNRRRHAVDRLGITAFRDRLLELEPDALLIDIELHAHIIAAVPLGIPTALVNQFFGVWKRPGVPPLHKPIVPGDGWRGSRWGIEWAWMRLRAGKLLARLRNLYQTIGVDDVAVLHHLAQRTGFPFHRETARYQWLLPFTYQTLPVLGLNATELDFPHDPHPALQYVGPMIRQERRTSQLDAEREAVIQSLIVEHGVQSTHRPLLLVLCSTFAAVEDGFVHTVLQAAAERPDWDVILSLGGKEASTNYDTLPDTVHVFPWVPVLALLPHADAVVTNAGVNTVNECIRYGVPPVVYSLGTNDQHGTAARVSYHDVGVVGELSSLSPERLVQHVDRALTDAQIRANIERMKTHFVAYEEAQHAVRFVEQLIAGDTSRPPAQRG